MNPFSTHSYAGVKSSKLVRGLDTNHPVFRVCCFCPLTLLRITFAFSVRLLNTVKFLLKLQKSEMKMAL